MACVYLIGFSYTQPGLQVSEYLQPVSLGDGDQARKNVGRGTPSPALGDDGDDLLFPELLEDGLPSSSVSLSARKTRMDEDRRREERVSRFAFELPWARARFADAIRGNVGSPSRCRPGAAAPGHIGEPSCRLPPPHGRLGLLEQGNRRMCGDPFIYIADGAEEY